jgi:hypothetical protein
MVSAPRYSEEDVRFRELFDSAASVVKNDGVLAGNTVVAGGLATFDGASGNVNYPTHPDIDDHWADGGTFEMWATFASAGEGSTSRLVIKGWAVQFDGDNNIKLGVPHSGTGGSWAMTGGELTYGVLHHIVLTYDNSSVANNPAIYIDGVAVTVNEAATPVGTPTTDVGTIMYLGNISADSKTIDGSITEVALYDRILTAAEVADRYNRTTFSDIDESKALVSVPMRAQYLDTTQKTENAGSLGGTVQLGDGSTASTFPTQLAPHGMTFDGGDYLRVVGSASALDFGEDVFTVTGWFRTSQAAGARHMLWGKASAADYQCDMEMDTAGVLRSNMQTAGGIGVYSKLGTVPVNDGQWHFFAVAFDTRIASEDTYLTVDEIEQTVVADGRVANNYNQTGAGDFVIGARRSDVPSLFWVGDLAKIKIYNAFLTPIQMEILRRRELRGFSA